MSHLRDIQKLRHNYNVQPYPPSAHLLSISSTTDKFNPNFDRFIEVQPTRQHQHKLSETYTRFNGSKELPQTSEKKNHRRGYSNELPMNDRRESDLVSSGLSMYRFFNSRYNFSMKLTPKVANPLTSRREKPYEVPYK